MYFIRKTTYMTRRLQFLFLFVFMLGALPAFSQRVVGYLPSYRVTGVYGIGMVQWGCLTDVNYSFINFGTDGHLLSTNNPGDNIFGFDLSSFNVVKGYCKPTSGTGPNLWVSVGGADTGNQRTTRFSSVMNNSTYRGNLATDLVNFAIAQNLYGVDIDWEFPASTGSDRANYTAFLSTLKSTIASSTKPSLKVSITVGGEYKNTVNHLLYIEQASFQYVDFVNVMTYDFPASYNADHSTLADSEASLTAYAGTNSYGITVPWNKLLIGIPFYGRNAGRTNLQEYMSDGNYATAYASGNASGYYYNSKTTMESKVDWVMSKGGSGVIIWDVGEDRVAPNNFQSAICARMATACAAPQPTLGSDIGVCLPGTVSLNSGLTTLTGRTFVWKKDGTVVSGQTGPTFSQAASGAVGNHTYTVEVTQSGCTRTDDVTVNYANPVTATGGSGCGGAITLTVTSTGGTYEWYDAATGGTLLNTGQTYAPSPASTTNYYVQQATGSTNYYTGRPSLSGVPNAASEFGANGTMARWSNKMIVSQSLTIQNIQIYTGKPGGVTAGPFTGAQLVAYSSIDGTTPLYASAGMSIPAVAAGTPMILSPNLTLPAGTYYIGLYVPGTAGGGNIWADNSGVVAHYVQAGVFDLDGQAYQNFGTGFAGTGSQGTTYGQIFNWQIVTGIVPPCSRTQVTATVSSGPAAPTGFAGSLTPCAGSTGNVYSVTNVAGVTYAWTYNGGTGATITGGAGTNSITVSYSAGATNGTWSVTPSQGTCTGTAFTSGTVVISGLPVQPSAITAGTATPCPNSTGNTYSVTSVAGVTYTWTYSGTGHTVTGGAGTAAITVTYASGTAGSWTVTPSNACGNGTAQTKAVTFGTVPAQPSAITAGTATPCPNSTGNTYSVTSVAGVTYTWTYSGTGHTVTGGAGTAAITVTYASGTAGTWTVTPSNACGNGTAQTKAVTFGTVPAQPSAITVGTATPCPNSTGNTYSVTSVAGVTYTWTYSGTGHTVTGGAGTAAITVTYASGTAGSWTVTPSNAC
ncbi:MAG: hypothetical protein JWM14_2809, partial [Chitinophagaceae bacterium]|nr:hypothetical protein [Chitinophagaceae bacterium]